MSFSRQQHQQQSGPFSAAVLASVAAGGLIVAAIVYWRMGGASTSPRPPHHKEAPASTAGGAASSTDTATIVKSPAVVAPSVAIDDTPERRQAIQLYNALKGQANAAFQKGALEDALQHYQDAVDVLAAIPVLVPDAEIVQLSQVVRANVVLVFLKMERYEDARMLATFLLQDDVRPPLPLLCKVLFRRATAMLKLGDVDGAIGDLEAAKHFSPTPDAVINDELVRVQKLKHQ